jgi:hypothetical protein
VKLSEKDATFPLRCILFQLPLIPRGKGAVTRRAAKRARGSSMPFAPRFGRSGATKFLLLLTGAITPNSWFFG